MWLSFFLPYFPFLSVSQFFQMEKEGMKKRLKRVSSGPCYTKHRESWPFIYLCQVSKIETILSALYDWVKKACARKSGSTEMAETRPAEGVGVIVWSCLSLERDITWLLGHCSSPCFHTPGLKNWAWGGFDCNSEPNQVLQGCWSSDDLMICLSF